MGMEEQRDSDEDYVPEYSKPVRRKSRAYQNTFKENDAFEDAQKDSSDSDPDFDPEDFEEVRSAKKSPKAVRSQPLIMNLKNCLRRRSHRGSLCQGGQESQAGTRSRSRGRRGAH